MGIRSPRSIRPSSGRTKCTAREAQVPPVLLANWRPARRRGFPDWLRGNPRTEARLAKSEEHTSELQSRRDLVCRLLLEKKNCGLPTYSEVSATKTASNGPCP